jgi:hypothetical protein
MPSAYLWPNVATIVDEPWLPTIVYPARGIADLWERVRGADRGARTPARADARTRSLQPRQACLDDGDRRHDRRYSGGSIPPLACLARQWTRLHLTARPRGPLQPQRAWVGPTVSRARRSSRPLTSAYVCESWPGRMASCLRCPGFSGERGCRKRRQQTYLLSAPTEWRSARCSQSRSDVPATKSSRASVDVNGCVRPLVHEQTVDMR